MELDIITFADLNHPNNKSARLKLEKALFETGIVGIKDIPGYEKTAREYIAAARNFIALDEAVKEQYAPLRDTGDTEGYESGAEKFLNHKGEWQTDDKKVSYYAFYPERPNNKWPVETNLREPYMALAELIFNIGKKLLNLLQLNDKYGLKVDELTGQCRMLYYRKEDDSTFDNPDWCGAHLDHGVFTGLIPAYYFRDDEEISEPTEAGLYIKPTSSDTFEKVRADDKSILLFQVGEFSQLLSNDQMRATQHIVKKASGGIERYTFAVFYDTQEDFTILSRSILTKDPRYIKHQKNNVITYGAWGRASFERYRA